ncbi:hypothetical protein SAMN05421848_1899 [Kushneria avicenniae]|uniref:Polyisoprenoid-binding protein YceI n=1 Tax=Kushneria avicenniae TaxID=402385 RepID=A0A1I1KN40_9GAMM|nr:hypothetical protein [Kushneria avicenniae]SFC58860.1 hypothetical protein SAMN05421848_1899 [Kushneria avicenniae]
MRDRFWKMLGVAGVTLAMTTQAHAAWQLVPANSEIKAHVAGEGQRGPMERTYHVSDLAGTINDDGQFEMPLRLEQTDLLGKQGGLSGLLSGLSSDSAMVTLSTKVNPDWLSNLQPGDSTTRNVTLTASGHHFERSEEIPLTLERLDQRYYHLAFAEPISVDTQQLMKLDNAQTVLSLLGYKRLNNSIPIELDARLIRQ